MKCKMNSYIKRALFVIKSRLYFHKLPKHIKKKIKELNDNSVCIDCGANIGVVSYILNSYGSDVYAFEPNPYAFSHLKAISSIYPGIFSHSTAVAFVDGTSKLFLHNESSADEVKFSTGSSMLDSKPNINSRDSINIKTINLEKFIEKFPSIDILKIDIEGFEVELLPALVNGDSLKNVKYIFVETHDLKWSELRLATKKMIEVCGASQYSKKIFYDWI